MVEKTTRKKGEKVGCGDMVAGGSYSSKQPTKPHQSMVFMVHLSSHVLCIGVCVCVWGGGLASTSLTILYYFELFYESYYLMMNRCGSS